MAETTNKIPGKVPWTLFPGILFLVVFQFTFAGIVTALEPALGPNWSITLQVLFYFLLIAAIVGYVKHRDAQDNLSDSRGIKALCAFYPVTLPTLLKAAFIPACVAFAAIMGWLLFHSGLQDWLGYSIAEQPQVEMIRERIFSANRYKAAATLFIAVIAAPVFEELLFRMLLYFPVREAMGVVKATILVSFFFALLHIYAVEGQLAFMMNAALIIGHLFVISTFFTILLEHTGSILSPILGHVGYNALVVGLVLYGV